MPDPAHSHKSLAVLICGKTAGKTRAENGEYVDIYRRFLRASLESHTSTTENHDQQPLWQFTLDPYDVFEAIEYPTEEKLDTYDGIIITGSPASAYDNVDWVNKLVAFTKHVADSKPRIKLIGICFGHQIIARALGGECVPNTVGWEVGPTPIALTNLGKQIFGVDSINLEEMHRDHVPVDRVPPDFQLLGSTPRSGNQGMVRFYPSHTQPPASSNQTSDSPPNEIITSTADVASYNADTDSAPLNSTLDTALLSRIQIFTVQGHPEWNEKVVTPLVEDRAASGIIDKPTAEDAMRRRFWRNDGVGVTGRVIWTILGV